jgi:hypothetical protein
MEFLIRALNKGERLIYVPDVLQFHQIDQSKLLMPYLIRKAYFRSRIACQLLKLNLGTRQQICRIAASLLRMAFNQLVKALSSISKDARRYHVVRLAAILGELHGCMISYKLLKYKNNHFSS